MAYQTSDLVSEIQRRAGDSGASSSEIVGYLNDEQNDIFNEYQLKFMKTSQSYTLTSGDADITHGSATPTNFDQAISLSVTTAGQEQTIPYMDMDDLESLYPDLDDTTLHPTGYPQYWYWDGVTPKVFPAPGTAYAVKLRYWKKPTLLANDSDVPDLPSNFREVLIRGGLNRVFEAKDLYDIAAIHQQRREEQLIKLVVRYSVGQTGQVHQMVINRAAPMNPSTTRWR
jgi:hypothetical protein